MSDGRCVVNKWLYGCSIQTELVKVLLTTTTKKKSKGHRTFIISGETALLID